MKSKTKTINFFTCFSSISVSLFLVTCINGELIETAASTTTTPHLPLPEGHCAISPSYEDKTALYICRRGGQNETCTKNGGTAVAELTKVSFTCNRGYYQVDNNPSTITCLKGSWQSEIPKCKKLCDELIPTNVDLSCDRNNNSIADCSGPFIVGDRVHPTCKQLHTYEGPVPDYQELVCQEDGKWDNTLFSCVLECGRPLNRMETLLISYDTAERFGDFPWHVAIFDITKKLLICGGTIIHPYLILSAAHCFHDTLNQSKLPEANYEVVVKKFTRNYAYKDNAEQKAFKIKEIRFSNKGSFANRTNFANDIAILILQKKIEISSTVLPACVDWTQAKKYSPLEGTLGKVVGWGANELGKVSERLLTANLPFISNTKCLEIVSDDFKSYITYDKFCAESENGTGVLQGDSGGGLLFQEGPFYYIRGVMSLKQPITTTTTAAIAVFTDVAEHITWIIDVRNKVEQDTFNIEKPLY